MFIFMEHEILFDDEYVQYILLNQKKTAYLAVLDNHVTFHNQKPWLCIFLEILSCLCIRLRLTNLKSSSWISLKNASLSGHVMSFKQEAQKTNPHDFYNKSGLALALVQGTIFFQMWINYLVPFEKYSKLNASKGQRQHKNITVKPFFFFIYISD